MKKEGTVEEVGSSRVLSFTVAHEKSGEYICEAQNLHGAVNSTILQINAPGQSVLDFTDMHSLFTMKQFWQLHLQFKEC